MAKLTEHQILHLKAVIKDSYEHSATTMKEDVSKIGIYEEFSTSVDYEKYLVEVRNKAQTILDSGEWPRGLEHADEIHDYLEGRVNNG